MTRDWRLWGPLGTVYVVWGSTYLGIRVMVETVSGLAALLIASVPLFVVVLRVLHRERMPAATLGGVAVGLAGVALVALPEGGSGGASTYLTLFGSLLAYSAFVWLLANTPVSLVSTYAYVNPVVALFLGWAVLDEKVTVPMAVGAAVVVASVALVVRRVEEPLAPPERASSPTSAVS